MATIFQSTSECRAAIGSCNALKPKTVKEMWTAASNSPTCLNRMSDLVRGFRFSGRVLFRGRDIYAPSGGATQTAAETILARSTPAEKSEISSYP